MSDRDLPPPGVVRWDGARPAGAAARRPLPGAAAEPVAEPAPERPLPARRPLPMSAAPPVHGELVVRPPTPVPSDEPSEMLRTAADVAAVVAGSAWRLAAWTTRTGLAGARYVVERAVAGDTAGEIMQDAAQELRAAAWRALGVTAPPEDGPMPERAGRGPTTAELRRRGAELLRLSNDVHSSQDIHPAFARILSELTPDEARILRFLYVDGPQPAIDVRTNRPLGIGSTLIAPGLNMIGEHAGCRNLDLVPQYLRNVQRLGLVDFSLEPVDNPQRYQVVEVQPKVAAAMRRAGRMPRTVHRSYALTEFGRSFCEMCLPVDGRFPAGGYPPP